MPIGEQIASLYVTVGADTSRFNAGLRGVQNNVRNAGRDLMNFAAVAAGALGGAAIISTVTNFESKMVELQARTGSTAAEMEMMRAAALEMGGTSVFSATQASDALLQLVASGSTATEAIGMLDEVLNLAASSGLELGTAADALTDILAMFQLDASNAILVSDALSQIAGISSADVADVIMAFNNVGPVAKNFGLGVRELAAAVGVLSDQGIKGAEAGTAIKSMLIQMSQQTADTRKAWDDLGTSLYDLEGNIRPLDEVLGEIKTGLADMTDEEQNATIQALAGSYGQLALRALLASGGISATVARMDDAATAAEVAEARTATFQGKIDRLKNSVEVLTIEALTPFIDNTLSPLVDHLIVVAGEVGNWANANPALASTIVTVGAAVIGLGIAGNGLHLVLSGIVAIGGPLVAGIGAIGGALLALMGPVGLVTGAVMVLLGAFALLANAQDAFQAEAVTAIGVANDLRGAIEGADRAAKLMTVAAGGEVDRIGLGVGMSSAVGPAPGESADEFFRRESEGRAGGGKVTAGRLYKVGESGVEGFIPAVDGRIVPHNQMGSGGGVTIPVTLTLDGRVLFETVVREDKRRNGRGW